MYVPLFCFLTHIEHADWL